MYKIILALLLTLGLLPLGYGQSMTQVTASKIQDAAGNKLANGNICFNPQLPKGTTATSFAPGGGGIVYPRAVCAVVTNGAIIPINLASSLYTSPVGVQYQITVVDNNTTESWVLGSTQVSGTTFSLDAFIPTATFTFYPNGPANVSGTLQTTGDITAPKFHGQSDSSLAADHFAVTPQSCPTGFSPTAIDAHGNFLNCVGSSFQTSGTTPGVIAQNPAGNQMITVPSGAHQRVGSSAAYVDMDATGNATAVQFNGPLNGVATHASNLPTDFATQSSTAPAKGTFSDQITKLTPRVDVRAYGAVADGTTDDGAAINAAVTAAPNGSIVLLGNNAIATGITIPGNKSLTFEAFGPVNITAAIGFSRNTIVAPCFRECAGAPNVNRVTFRGITFNKSNSGTVIKDFQPFASAGNAGVTLLNNTFNLSSGAIGLQTMGADHNYITNDMFKSSDGTMIALQPYADFPGNPAATATVTAYSYSGSTVTLTANNAFVAGQMVTLAITVGPTALNGQTLTVLSSGLSASQFQVTASGSGSGIATGTAATAKVVNSSQTTTVTGCTFVAGHAVVPVLLNAAADSWEGWLFNGNQFFTSTIDINHGNSVNLVSNEISSAQTKVENSSNELIEGNYFDTNNNGDNLLTISATIHVQILGNQFIAQGRTSMTGIHFMNGTFQQSTNITLMGNVYVGANNLSDGTGGVGVNFQDGSLRNVYLGGENFRQLTAALTFSGNLQRSTIDKFEARDVFYYAQGLAAIIANNPGNWLRVDNLYQVFTIHLTGLVATGITVSNTVIASENLTFDSFFTNPDTSNSSQSCSKAGVALTGGGVHQNGFLIDMLAQPTATTGYVQCDMTVVADGTLYSPPR